MHKALQQLIGKVKKVPYQLGEFKVYIKEMTVREKEELEHAISNTPAHKPKRTRAYILHYGVVDEEGRPIVPKNELQLVDNLPASIVDQLCNEVLRVNGISEQGVADIEKK